MFRQGLDFHFEISEVEITRVNCISEDTLTDVATPMLGSKTADFFFHFRMQNAIYLMENALSSGFVR